MSDNAVLWKNMSDNAVLWENMSDNTAQEKQSKTGDTSLQF